MRLWTLKEAYVKAPRTGIAAHPLRFDVETKENPSVGAGEIALTSEPPGRTIRGRGVDVLGGGWRFMLVRVREGDGLIAAVRVAGDVDDVDDEQEEEEPSGGRR